MRIHFIRPFRILPPSKTIISITKKEEELLARKRHSRAREILPESSSQDTRVPSLLSSPIRPFLWHEISPISNSFNSHTRFPFRSQLNPLLYIYIYILIHNCTFDVQSTLFHLFFLLSFSLIIRIISLLWPVYD